jgi:hypothetical protein
MPHVSTSGPRAEPGVELDHKELTSTFSVTGIGAAAMTDVTGLATLQFTMPVDGRPVMIEVNAPSVTVDTAQKLMVLSVCKTDNTVIAQFSNAVIAAAVGAQLTGRKRLTTADFPAGTTVQLKLRAHVQTGAATGSLNGTTTAPLSLRAIKG